MKRVLYFLLLLFPAFAIHAEDGYRLWLRYDLVSDPVLLNNYRALISSIDVVGTSPVLNAAATELETGLQGLFGKKIPSHSQVTDGCIIAGTTSSPLIASLALKQLTAAGQEGFCIYTMLVAGKKCIVIAANTDAGVLYGSFHLLRLIQTHQNIRQLSILSVPKIQYRILDHWDNLNRSVERGYAGISIWDWHTLPDYLDKRYTDYARANASVGINGAVLTNVNANALILTREYMLKVAALADILRPYGIRVYLTARFSAPVEIGGLKTADPLAPEVQLWWKSKIDSLYQFVPDFGGFLVKANSEGQPGPQTYGRTHADGANMLADVIAPHHGIIMWRAFVYSESAEDRFKQAYNEFQPLDGKFRSNVLVQVKNGPIDFQPREPFSPLFGAMPKTPLMMEFQLTQEYLGQGTHLVYEAPLFKECLDADTYAKGAGSTVASVIDGSMDHHTISGIAGVANIGNERNWTGHPFGQANWYAFGRIAWNHELSAAQVADEWIRQTFSNDSHFVDSVKKIMIVSREAVVNYMTPLGLHHIMGYSNHYGPAPWYNSASRADWNPVYFHKADSAGIGFDRTNKGSNALSQYAPQVASVWGNLISCPEAYLLWFHHVPWNYTMQSGRTLWLELCNKYQQGVDQVRYMENSWAAMKPFIDDERFRQVSMLLDIQKKEAVWWRNACLLYFQTFSKMPFPEGYEKSEHTLPYYEALKFPYAPGSGK